MQAKPTFSQARSAARQRVLQALYQWQLTALDTQLIESQFLEEQDMQKADVSYFKLLLHGIPPQINELDTMFAPFLDRNTTQLDPIELAILRIGCYELKNCPKVPFKVVINEAVELAKKFGADKSHKYVNGVLDKLAHHRNKKKEIENKESEIGHNKGELLVP
ncbi:transcription antitermination factor NusB [Candidatus Parabeggiatoa sp. HSG14]|uniref:transcription antitermination factor NusB n=1 Tax=Candidatus Parabeggiatoa sp. HSG14 TaxID=3055593 RepID=UPI0025A72CC5|nr:transcription antitermination factor NusB [Thiotrichales bacterium HSG14]